MTAGVTAPGTQSRRSPARLDALPFGQCGATPHLVCRPATQTTRAAPASSSEHRAPPPAIALDPQSPATAPALGRSVPDGRDSLGREPGGVPVPTPQRA